MTAIEAVSLNRQRRPTLATVERYLTLWVVLCIVAGIGLGQLIPVPFHVLGRSSIA